MANEIGTTIQQQNGDNRAIRARTLKADTAAIGISNAITFGVKIWIVVSAISQELTVGSIYQMLSAFDSMQTLLQSLVYQISSGYEQSLYVSMGAFGRKHKNAGGIDCSDPKNRILRRFVFLSRLSKASIKEREFNADNGELIYDYWGKWQRKKHTD
mgnify:CR=1 FL=1